MLIRSAAHFRPCPRCGSHGALVTADGRESQQLFSKEFAKSAIAIGVSTGYFAEDEAGILRQQVNASDLVPDASPYDDIEALANLFGPACTAAGPQHAPVVH